MKEASLLSIEPLRPTEDSTSSIRAAFFRLRAARDANAAEMAQLNTAMSGPMILKAAPAELAQSRALLDQRRFFGEQLDTLEPELRRLFDAALDREEAAEYAAALNRVMAKAQAWDADFSSRYPVLAQELIELLRREQQIAAEVRDLWKLPGAERVAAASQVRIRATAPAYITSRVEWGPAANFADTVVLPALVQGNVLWRGQHWKPHP